MIKADFTKEEYEPKPDNKYPGHCGIYLGNKEFIHCPRSKKLVRIDNLKEGKYWISKLVGSKSIIKK